MDPRIQVGSTYRHFKGGIYRIIAIAKNCNDPSKTYVVYRNITDESLVWSREYDEFASKVDKEKYPDAAQEYRFESVLNIP